MLKWIILIGAAIVLYMLFKGDKKRKADKLKKEEERMAATGVLVRDPVCGTYVSKDSDIRVKEGDTVHAFCSYECREKYIKKLEEKGGGAPPEGEA